MSKLPDPDYAAIKLRHELSIDDSAAVDFGLVLPTLNIRICEESLKEGTLGACKVEGLWRLIIISTAITYEAQKRFTIAHETGHILLHHGTCYCTKDDLFGYQTIKGRENDANQFASAFLLPQTVVSQALKYKDISFDMAEKLTEQYGISLTATLIRLVKSSSDNVCLFVHSGGKIEYAIPSPGCSFRPKSGLIDECSLANRLTSGKTNINGDTNSSFWFEDNRFLEDSTCIEESRLFKNLQKTITIVNINSDDM